MTTTKKVLLILALVASALSTALGAYGAKDSIRLVDFVKIFAGGFLLGVTVLGYVRALKAPGCDATPPTAPPPRSKGSE
jgi:amino acid transporter